MTVPRFYYGWAMVAYAAAAMSATLPGRTYGLGIIKEKLCTSFAIDDLDFSLLNFWAIVAGSVFVLPTAWLIDRVGVRRVLTVNLALLGIAVVLMANARDKTELAISLTLVRGLGQGALSVVAIAMVGKWFRKRIGLAMGLFTLLLGIGFLVPITVLGEAVKVVPWQDAWRTMGYALIAAVPLAALLVRSTPESMGVSPDEAATESAPVLPLKAAMKQRRFWIATAGACLFNLVFSALTLDSAALLRSRGLNPDDCNDTILGTLMLGGLMANIVAGFLSRRFSLDALLGSGLVILAAALLFFPFVASLPGALVYAVLLGVAGGVITVVFFALYGHAYGRPHLGGIQGFVQMLTVLASAIGPVILSVSEASAFFNGFAIAAIVVATLALQLARRESSNFVRC